MEAEMVDFSADLATLLDIEKLKYCYECGICTASCPMMELLPKHYNPRVLLERILLDSDRVLKEGGLWLCAWCYRCYRRCPQRLRLPEVFLKMRTLAAKKGYLRGFKEATELIHKDIPLPEVCQQVCFHPERAKIDTSQITNLAHKYGESEEIPPSKSGAQRGRIVIIGSGPAGLTAGQELARRRYQVIVFESLPKPGGMLRACMPSYRLSRDILDSEIEHIENLGVEIRTGVTIGKDLTIADLLQEGYQALFIATGAHKTRELSIDGIHLNGVTYALDFLRKVNRKEKAEVGERVCVIGGGNVAMDAARTALREGAKAVCILYRRSREEMPANPWEVKEAESEGVEIRFLTSPRKILGKKGQVTAIECVRTELGELDESGRRRPRPIEGSEFVEECDMVMVAIGEKPDLSFLPGEIEVGEKNTILVDPFTMETSMPGVFAGGDVVSGPATVIEAIVDGKRAAFSIDRYLKGKETNSQKIAVSTGGGEG